MSVKLNTSGASNAASLVASGNYDTTSSWSFTAADEDKLLGEGKDDWANYSKWHLGIHTDEAEKTKAHYGYPFGKDGKVYRSALTAIRQRASQAGATAIFDKAGELLDSIDKKSKKEKSLSPEEVRAYITSKPHYRIIHQNRDAAIDKETRTIPMTFSSDKPISRWWGIEVLNHDPGAVRMDRASGGLAFLDMHDMRRQGGRIENYKNDGNNTSGDVRFARTALGDELLSLHSDKIRLETSQGYLVHRYTELAPEDMTDEMKQMALRDKCPVYRIDDWEPIEGSSVSIPADTSVGHRGLEYYDDLKAFEMAAAGRSFDLNSLIPELAAKPEEGTTTITGARTMTQQTQDPPAKTQEEILRDERQRVADIEAIAAKFTTRMPKIAEIRTEAINKGVTVGEFKGLIADRMASDGGAIFTPDSLLGLSEKDKKRYSLIRLIQSKMPNSRVKAEYEEECSTEIAKRIEKRPNGTFIPWDIQNRENIIPIGSESERAQLQRLALEAGLVHAARALTTTTTSGAKELIATDLRADLFVELLRHRAVAGRAGVQVLFGLQGNISMPRQTGAANFEWTGETGTTSGSALTTGSLPMSPKEGRAFQEYTRLLLLQSTPSIETLVQNDLLTIARLGVDKAVFHGLGNSNQPKGIAAETGIGAVTGANLGWDAVVEFETDVAVGDADINTMFYVTNPKVRGLMKTRPKQANYPLYLMDDAGMVNGYPSIISNQISDGYLFFGDFSQEILGYWGNLDILVNPYAGDKDGLTRVNIYVDVDTVLRQVVAIAASADVS
jgi:HK97 family phage major capsid protein